MTESAALLLGLMPNEAPQTGFTQSHQAVIVVVNGQRLSLHAVIQSKQSEIPKWWTEEFRKAGRVRSGS